MFREIRIGFAGILLVASFAFFGACLGAFFSLNGPGGITDLGISIICLMAGMLVIPSDEDPAPKKPTSDDFMPARQENSLFVTFSLLIVALGATLGFFCEGQFLWAFFLFIISCILLLVMMKVPGGINPGIQ